MTVDHIANALSRLPQQLIDKPNFQTILTALVRPFQDLEDMYQDLLLLRGVLTATGVTLTNIGELVGEPRNGNEDDDDYRRHIRARIWTNRSSGTIPELVRIAKLIVYDDNIAIVVEKQTVSTIVFRIIDISHEIAHTLASFLREAVSADGNVILEYTTSVTYFQLDSGPGLDNGPFSTALDHLSTLDH